MYRFEAVPIKIPADRWGKYLQADLKFYIVMQIWSS